MSIILAIETSTQQCSVALCKLGEIYTESTVEPRAHSKVLLPMIESVLGRANCQMNELSSLAVAYGPGTFTGLRIGVGVVKGLAFGQNLPIYGVSSLAVLAYGMAVDRGSQQHTNQYLIPVLDARMSELYWGCYQYKNQWLTQLKSDCLLPVNQKFKTENFVLGGTGVELLDGAVVSQSKAVSSVIYPSAEMLLNYVLSHQSKLKKNSAESLTPFYLRNKIV